MLSTALPSALAALADARWRRPLVKAPLNRSQKIPGDVRGHQHLPLLYSEQQAFGEEGHCRFQVCLARTTSLHGCRAYFEHVLQISLGPFLQRRGCHSHGHMQSIFTFPSMPSYLLPSTAAAHQVECCGFWSGKESPAMLAEIKKGKLRERCLSVSSMSQSIINL